MNYPTTLPIRYLLVALLLGYWMFIFLGTHTSHPPQIAFFAFDKVLHLLAYAGLGFLLAAAAMRRQPNRSGAVLVLNVVLCYGLIDELTQGLVPHRSMDFWDWVADAMGGTVGIAGYWLIVRTYRTWRWQWRHSLECGK